MSEFLARQFIDALLRLERDRQLDDLVGLYREDAVIGNVLEPSPLEGPRGARSFWSMYRDTFQEVHSSFRCILSTEGGAALEWTSKGTSRQGQPFSYDGMTLLEFQDGKIARSWAYFDPSALGSQLRQPTVTPFDPGA